MPRRILKAKINFLSLCPRGANQLPTILKADDTFDIQTLVKANGDFDVRGELLNVVYAPELRDSQGDIASAEVIKDAMYEAAKNGMNIDIRHNNVAVAKDKAYIAESFLVQKGDARFADFKDYNGKPVDVTGAWATVVKIDDPDLRAKYKSGEWNGVSMGGHAAFAAEKADDGAGMIEKLLGGLAKLFSGGKPAVPDGDDDMKPEDIAKLKTEVVADVTTALTATLTKAGIIKAEAPTPAPGAPAAPAAPAVEAAPVFKGDWTKPEDIRAHQKAVKLFDLKKTVDWTKPESVDAYLAEVAKLEGTTTTTTTTVQKTAQELEVERLEKELAAARRQSNQPVGNGAPTAPAADGMVSQLAKEDVEAATAGYKVAQALNKSRGYK